MSEPSPSTESAVVASDNDSPDQPSGPARTPGTRTPRRVQWATAVDEDEDDGDYHRLHTVDEGDGDRHGLDQAGLDVCRFLFFYICTHSFRSSHTACCIPYSHSCPRTSSSLKFHLTISDSARLYSCPAVQTASIIYTLLGRVVRATFSRTPLIWD
jgi:hypothetical protein